MDSMNVEDDDRTAARLDDLAGRLSSMLIRLPGGDIEAGFEGTLREIVEIVDADRSTLVKFSPDTSMIDTAHTWARPGIPPFQLPQDLPQLRWLLERIEPGATVGVAGGADLPPDGAGVRAHEDRGQIKSALVVLINVADRRTCALSVDSFRRPRDWPAPTLTALRFIGEILAGSLHRRRQERALEHKSVALARAQGEIEPENACLGEEARNIHGVSAIIGDSPAFRGALNHVQDVAPTDITVLLLGETGTGKEIIARALHDASARRGRALVRVNCGALPAALVETELFGHERGAFTGAVAARQGRFELADRGSIFLDEIGDLPLELQPKLLRVLQEGEFERIGSSRTRRVDVRVIAATHRNLEAAVEEGSFREDLYYRISVFPITLPPLRERQSDIPKLVWRIIRQRARTLNRNIHEVPTSVMQALQRYDWPGNVRELENVIERAMIRSAGDTLALDECLSRQCESTRETGVRTGQATLEEVERRHVGEMPRACGWRISGPGNAAQRLGLHPNTLRFRMKKLGIMRPSAA